MNILESPLPNENYKATLFSNYTLLLQIFYAHLSLTLCAPRKSISSASFRSLHTTLNCVFVTRSSRVSSAHHNSAGGRHILEDSSART